jgi:hypothetical protein
MSAWALKLWATLITVVTLAGSYGYASTHLKNPNAPLQPPVADRPAPSAAAPTPAPSVGPLFTLRPGQRPPTATAAPRLTLAPGVRTASLAPITLTHVS